MTTRTLAATAAVAVALAGCIRDPDPFTVDTDDPAVHLLLVAGSDSVQAIVERPGNLAEDALVRLIEGGDTTSLHFSGPACTGFFGPNPPAGCHRARLDEPIQPGATYELEVILENGSRVTGSTVVPEALTLTAPAAGTRFTVRCDAPDTCYAAPLDQPPYFVPVLDLTVRWEETVPAERLFGHVRAIRTFRGTESYPAPEGCVLGYFTSGFLPSGGTGAAVDSMRLVAPNIFCAEPLSPAVFDSIHAEAVVQEMSSSYEAYLDAISDGSSTRDVFVAEGLEGAWGVFGALTPTTVPITLIRQPAPQQRVGVD